MAATDRERAHELIDELPPLQLAAVVGFLEAMLSDPVAHRLAAAPIDDETEGEGEGRAAEEARKWLREQGGGGIPHEQVLEDVQKN